MRSNRSRVNYRVQAIGLPRGAADPAGADDERYQHKGSGHTQRTGLPGPALCAPTQVAVGMRAVLRPWSVEISQASFNLLTILFILSFSKICTNIV